VTPPRILGSPPVVLGGPFGSELPAATDERLRAFREAGGAFVETAFSSLGGRSMAAVGA
jgi:hypothetical protein